MYKVEGRIQMGGLGNKEIMARNISKYMDKMGVDRNKLSSDLDIKYTTLTDWINGKTYPRIDKIELLANYFGISKSDLVEDASQNESKIINLKQVKEMKSIPILGDIACGDPITAEENIQGYRDEVADTLPTGNLFYLHCKGDSMAPTIPDGAYVLIRQQPDVEDGEIAAVLVNGDTEATLKRVKRQGSLVMLMPDNQSYDPYVVTPDNPARILGKALKMSADL